MDMYPPVFILGSPRSGTSLLSRIINSHSEIGVPFESLLYSSLYGWHHYYGDLSERSNRIRLVDDMLSLSQIRAWTPRPDRTRVLELYKRFDFHGAVEALIQAWLETQGKKRWGEKSPWHAYYWRVLLEGFPEARFIHIVRDGRDAAMSWKAARFGPRHYYALAHRWVDYLQTVDALRAERGDRLLEVQYEALLEQPEATVRTICTFLGVSFEPNMLSFYEQSTPYPTDARNDFNLTRPLMRQNKQKWKTGMTARQLRIFEAIAGGMLERFGYERGDPDARLTRYERLQMQYLEHPVSRFYGMLRNKQGYAEAIRLWGVRGRLWLTGKRSAKSLQVPHHPGVVS